MKRLGPTLVFLLLAAACGGITDPDASDDPTGSLPTEGTYDFAADLVSIVGNIDAVNGCDSADFDFVDDFSDDLANSGCTGQLTKVLGTFSESSRLLRMPGPDAGIQEAQYFGHIAQFGEILVDGLGDAEFEVRFRADTPSGAPPPSHYGIKIVDDSRGPFFEAVVIQVQSGDVGETVIRAFRSRPNDDGISTQTTVDIAPLSRIHLKLHFLDNTDRILPSYSLDGGTTFNGLLNADGSNFSVPEFPVSGQTTALFQVFGAELIG